MKERIQRVHYIDNLRWITVSLLIPFHAAMAYNTWGEDNYIFFEGVKPLASIPSFISPWFMPLMFLLAGASSYYSLRKRGFAAFMRERLLRLGVPLVFGILVIDPVMSYLADVTHNGYAGGFLAHYGVFFTRYTDFTGYDGGFTPGHLWFIAVLIFISLISCAIIKTGASLPENRKGTAKKAAGIILTAAAAAAFDLRPAGKPLITYLCVYLLGYYFFSDRGFVARLSKYKAVLTALFLVSSALDVYLFIYKSGYGALNTVCYYASFVTGVPALVSIGHDHLDRSGSFSAFCSRISYVFYIIHFPVVLVCQYLFGAAHMTHTANFLLTLAAAYPLTAALCFVVEKTHFLRFLFGMKISGRKQPADIGNR